MKRNLMLMGGKTYIISLPADWVRKHGLKKGQELQVEDDVNRVVISTNGMKHDKKALSMEYSRDFCKKLIKSYQLGYDEIKLTGKINADELQASINSLMPGFEIIRSEKGYCIIQCLSEMEQKDFDAVLRRALLLLTGNRNSALRSINLCKRCISKNGYRNYSESLVAYNFLCEMEAMAASGKIGKGMQEVYDRFTELSFEELETMPFASPLQDMALVRV